MTMIQIGAEKVAVVSQKVDPDAVIEKGKQSFGTTIICVMADGTERKHRVSCTRKRDLLKKLERLPIDNVTGMELGEHSWTIELFGYNGV